MFKILGSQYKQKNKSIKDDLILKRVKKYGQLFPWETLIEKKKYYRKYLILQS